MTNPVTFLLQTQDELKKVTWPKGTEVTRLTAVVIIVSFAVGIYIGAIDFLLTQLTTMLIQ